MSTVDITTDVLVIGAGPIGLTTACLLADYGVTVTVAEKQPSVTDLPRAISATGETLRIMDQIGIMDRLGPEMLKNTGARYFGRADRVLADAKPVASYDGHPAKNQFDQPVMEELLLGAARERTTIDLRFNTEAFRIRERSGGADVIIVDDEGKKTVHAQWVVAADGGRSPTRSQLGIELVGSTQVQKWIVVDVINSTTTPELFAEFHANGTRPVVIVPGVKGRRRYEFMLLPEETEKQVLTDDVVVSLISPYEQGVTSADIRRAAVYVAHQRTAATYRSGHTLLIGDAAHLMPPFAGQALNAGIRDAANLSWKLAAVITEGAPESLIDTYELERRPHALKMVRLSRLIGKFVMATGMATWVRDGVVAALGLVPPAKRWLAEMRFLTLPRFTEGVVVDNPALPQALRRTIGTALPQPRVRVVAATSEDAVGLDTVLGLGWASLTSAGGSRYDITPRARPTVTVDDLDGYLASYLVDLPVGTTVLVRPDRYIAGIVDTAEADGTIRRLLQHSH